MDAQLLGYGLIAGLGVVAGSLLTIWWARGMRPAKQYAAEALFAALRVEMHHTHDVRIILQKIAAAIATQTRQKNITLYVYHNKKTAELLSVGTAAVKRLPRQDPGFFDEYVRTHQSKVIDQRSIAPSSHLGRILKSHRFQAVVPLMHDSTIVGYITISKSTNPQRLDQTLALLETVAEDLAILIDNALFVERSRHTTARLEHKIADVETQLRAKNQRLEDLDSVKNEFLSIASHQLRTPLTSVKGYISMLLDGDAGKLNKQQKVLLEQAFASSERMVHLIHDFLNVSRLQTGRFALENEETDLVALVRSEVKNLDKVAASRRVTLKTKIKLRKLLTNVDSTKLRQVVMNFIDNAIFYSPEGSTVTIEMTKTDDEVTVIVKDEGMGVPRHEQAGLFTKFYRASNARTRRPDGTGVGLYLAKKVIDAHNGTIIFSSTEQKGSQFGFTLPLK